MQVELPLRPITVDEYHRMAEAGIFDEDERVELLDGMLVEMPPTEWPHGLSYGLTLRHLFERLGGRFFVSGDISIPLGPRDEPQPDIAIFRLAVLGKKRKSELKAADIVALIEISDS